MTTVITEPIESPPEWALQVWEDCQDHTQAQEILCGLSDQNGFLWGRIVEPCPSRPRWAVQTLHVDDGEDIDFLEGVRRVIVPPAIKRAMVSAWKERAGACIVKLFKNDGTSFSAFRAVQSWCCEHNISMGSMQGSAPIGLAYGDCDISKWRNMTAADREELDGCINWINGGPRDGDACVTLKEGSKGEMD